MDAAAHPTPGAGAPTRQLVRLMWLAIAAAVATISLKFVAYVLTGSVGLLSDAAESIVNLVAAVLGLVALRWATQPADEDHAYGHDKANYLSAGAEGAMIIIAAVFIMVTAVERLSDLRPIEDAAVGLVVSVVASVVNLVVARLLIGAGRRERSLILEADGQHLMADVWTSAGVIAGITLVALTGWEVLDPLIAIAVAANIVVTGLSLIRRSTSGLMDRALPAPDLARVQEILDSYASDQVQFHALRTRQSGPRSFISVHVLVPGDWTVQRGHDLVEQIEVALAECFTQASVFTHLEPIEDPLSFQDEALDR